MTVDDARGTQNVGHPVPAEGDRDRADRGHASRSPQIRLAPDQLQGTTSGRLTSERTPARYSLYRVPSSRPAPADETPGAARRELSRGADASEDTDPGRCPACSSRVLVDTYEAERDRARAELVTVRRLVERHITTHGLYADRRLREWYDATARR